MHIRIQDVSDVHRNMSCVGDLPNWCASKRQQLNPSKTKIIRFGTSASLKKLSGTDLSLHIGTDSISPANLVRDFGVLLDNEISMTKHKNKLAGVCLYHLRRLKKSDKSWVQMLLYVLCRPILLVAWTLHLSPDRSAEVYNYANSASTEDRGKTSNATWTTESHLNCPPRLALAASEG